MADNKYAYKIAIVGGGGVGKSSLTIQYIQGVFIEEYDPTIEDSYRKYIDIDGNIILLEILDTAGQEEYKSLRDQYMRIADGFILVYSIIDAESLHEIEEYYNQIIRVKDTNDVPMVLVGNKCDLENYRQITKKYVLEYSNKLNIQHYEVSAKKNININKIFDNLLRKIISLNDNRETTNHNMKCKKNKKCIII